MSRTVLPKISSASKLKISSDRRPHPRFPNWEEFDAEIDGVPVTIGYRIPTPGERKAPPIQFTEQDLQADPSTTWGAIVAHLTAPPSTDRKTIPILGGID